MNATHDFTIRISPESGRVTVENDVDGVITHKEISRNTLIKCFCTGIRADTPGRGTGMLPLNTLAVWQSESELRIVLWYPKLRANVALYDTPYPNFPLPRLVFGATFDEGGKLTGSRLGVVADEVPTPDRLGHSAHKAELIHIYIVLIAELYDPLPNSLSDSHGRHLFPAGKRLPNTACKV